MQTGTPAGLRAWLVEVMEQTGLKPTPLAKGAGIAPSTVLRQLEDDAPGELSIRTIRKIVETYNVAPPEGFGISAGATPLRGLAEPDAVFVEQAAPLQGMKAGADQAVWQLKGRGLELEGYLPGDYLLVDFAVAAETGDVVCVQIYDTQRGDAETVFRVYDRPYLVTATADPQARRKPIAEDGERVVIRGPVVRSWRMRRAS
jgi:hypothetical protein